MPITQTTNSKANVKKQTTSDFPAQPAYPVAAYYNAVSTAAQTTIANLGFSVDTTIPGAMILTVDGKTLTPGTGNDYIFTGIDASGMSSSIQFNQSLAAGFNIQALKLGVKRESEFQTDNRFTQIYEAQGQAFQAFVNTTSALVTATTNVGTPAAGTFYSTIQNRASLPDLSQNLKVQMGVERIPVQQIALLQSEFGPNGEQVWSAVNDQFGQIRYIGNWTSVINAFGEFVQASTSGTDSLEITFYGTALNLLIQTNGTATYTYSVDGATPVAVVGGSASASGTIDGRNYNANQVVPVVSGLTLGVHTIRIVSTVSYGLPVYGFEVINAPANVITNPGISYTGGKKAVTTVQSSIPYNALVTGVRGGRVLQYQTAAGAIAQAWQPVNAASAFLTAADHTNEEAVRTYLPREFGSGRTDDFSTLTTTVSARAFTLEDASTSLVASAPRLGTGFGGVETLYPNASTDFITLTFVGTGLDLIVVDTNSSAGGTCTYSIDGGTPATIPGLGIQAPHLQKIVSGLPYGTHTFKYIATSGTATTFGIQKFIVYQPKKPALPAGAIEIADYNVMANFIANATSGAEFLATGILRKVNIREVNYTGTWNTTALQVGGGTTGTVSGWQTNCTTTGATIKYTFYGTGFDCRLASPTTAASYTMTIDGLTPSAAGATTSGFYGNITSFSLATGVVGTNTTGNYGHGVWLNGLPLGPHTVILTYNSGQSLNNEAFDVITPIHSQKSNLYIDAQDTLPVGSQGISDNRKFSAIKDSLPAVKGSAQAFGVVSGPSTTASYTTMVPIPDMICVVKTSGGALEIDFNGQFQGSTAGMGCAFAVYVNGLNVSPNVGDLDAIQANGAFQVVRKIVVQVGAGTHNVAIYWGVFSNTLSAYQNDRTLIVKER